VFGKRSERSFDDANQQFIEGLIEKKEQVDPVEIPEILETAAKRKKHPGRKPLPESLPRIREEILPKSEDLLCHCGREKEKFGEEITEELDFKPASFFVKEIVRPKYACKDFADGVTIADAPFRPIQKGMPGSGLLAQVSIAKYVDHLPLYRQEKIFKRHGVDISQSTMVNWIKNTYELLTPVYEEIKTEVLKSFCINADETGVRVLDKDKKHTCHNGYVWVYVGDNSTVFMEYRKSRNRDGPSKLLTGFKGYLQADAYGGYNEIVSGGNITRLGCWAHARRKFFDCETTDPELSKEIINTIKGLYAVESNAKDNKLSAKEIFELRQKNSKPILDEIKDWLEDKQLRTLPKSPMGKAISYSLKQWDELIEYLNDGKLSIDKNVAERAIRPIAVGRKNWMFCGSHEGAKRMALIYTLVETYKMQGVEPFEYLRDVISRISAYPMKKIYDLTPMGWKKLREKAIL